MDFGIASILKKRITQLLSFVGRNEHLLSPLFLLGGLVWNAITLRRVDLLPETIVLYVHLGLASVIILLEHLSETRGARNPILARVNTFLPLALSFIFGSLYTIFFVFYTKSASLADSWLFVAVLFGVILGIEAFKKYKTRFVFNLSIYFFALLSFSIFAVPLWVGDIGTDVFVESVLFAFCVFASFVLLLFFVGKTRVIENLRAIVASVILVAVAVGISYTTNIIPPIPLALKDIGVYHSLEKGNGSYILRGESPESLAFFLEETIFTETVHVTPEQSLTVFSSVFTPVVIKTDEIHRWEQYDEAEKDWKTEAVFTFPIGGGREQGYRGYSTKEKITPGRWRVSVETPDGLKIGRVSFTVVSVAVAPTLFETIR